ncbi:MAG TPA: hypothetical protein VIG44_11680 [Thermomicrobiales bacterium]
MAGKSNLEVIEGGKAGEPAPEPPKKRLPERVVTLPLPDVYEEFHVTAQLNFGKATLDDLMSGVEEPTMEALKRIVRATDLVDFDGEPYPAPATDAFWEELPRDLLALIIQTVIANVGKLPGPTAAR